MSIRRFALALGFALVCSSVLPAPAPSPPKYSETIAVMQTALKGELIAHAKYIAYAQKARDEGYPSLGEFAYALSASEAIHARNFIKVLFALGVAGDQNVPAITVADTKSNLKSASAAEMDEIDNRYPALLERLKPEAYAPALEALSHAWLAEKQHRDMIAKLIAGTGLLFGLVVKNFQDNHYEYFVCQNCGSTLTRTNLPKATCPICEAPVEQYKKVSIEG